MSKDCKIKILIAVLITGALTFFLTKEFAPEYEVIDTKTDTTSTVKTTIEVTENTFSAEQVGNIKRVLMDSLSAVYGTIINSLSVSVSSSVRQSDEEDSLNLNLNSEYAYVSEIDSNFAAVDDSGNVTDSLHITSTFISPNPLPENSVHLMFVKHKSYSKETTREITITTTNTVVEKKSFFERFSIAPNISLGVGIFSKQFDMYAGVGFTYDLTKQGE